MAEEEDLVLRLLLKLDPNDSAGGAKAVGDQLDSLRAKAQATTAAMAAIPAAMAGGFDPRAPTPYMQAVMAGTYQPPAGVSTMGPTAGGPRQQYGIDPRTGWMTMPVGPGAPQPPAPAWQGPLGLHASYGVGQRGAYWGSSPGVAYPAGMVAPHITGLNNGMGAFTGPISDPGSWAQSSLSTGRGYDQALLRQHLEGLNVDKYDASFKKLAMSMTQVHTGLMSLTAGVILFNKSLEEGSGFDNWYTQAIAVSQFASGGGYLARGAGGLIRGAAGAGSSMLGNAAMAAGYGAGGRALAVGSRALGGIAGMSGAALAGGAAIAGLGFANVWEYSHGGMQGQGPIGRWLAGSAGIEAQSLSLSDQYSAAVYGRGFRNDFYGREYAALGIGFEGDAAAARFGGLNAGYGYSAGLAGGRIGRAMARGRFTEAYSLYGGMMAGAAGMQSRTWAYMDGNDALSSRYGAQIRGARTQYGEAMERGDTEGARRIAEQIYQLEQKRNDLAQRNTQAWREQVQYMAEAARLGVDITRAEIDRAEGARDSMGHMSSSKFNRGLNYYDRAMRDGKLDEREARRLERWGFGNTEAVTNFWEEENQNRINRARGRGLGGLTPEGSKTSAELKALEDKLAALEAERDKFAKTYQSAADMEIEAMQKMVAATERLAARIKELETRLATTGGGR